MLSTGTQMKTHTSAAESPQSRENIRSAQVQGLTYPIRNTRRYCRQKVVFKAVTASWYSHVKTHIVCRSEVSLKKPPCRKQTNPTPSTPSRKKQEKQRKGRNSDAQ